MQIRQPQPPLAAQAGIPPHDWVEIPAEMCPEFDRNKYQGRLIDDLRNVAGNPLEALKQAVLKASTQPRIARACAELAVTGYKAWSQFKKADPDALPQQIAALAVAAAPTLPMAVALDLATHQIAWARNVAAWLRGVTKADRDAAYKVLHPNPADPRPWVAVSGEKDCPDRPVNLPCTDYNQDDVTVSMGAKSIRVRVGYSDDVTDPNAPTKVILFIHGLGSRLEETEKVSKELLTNPQYKGKYGFIALDLPNQGYSERFGFTDVIQGDMTKTGSRDANGNYIVLAMDFYVLFLNEFLKEFSAKFPAANVLSRLVAIAGGSQGGCLV